MSEITMIECDVCQKRADKNEVGATWGFRVEVIPYSAPHRHAAFHICPDCRPVYTREICDYLDKLKPIKMVRR
jgi:hypothetical protein